MLLAVPLIKADNHSKKLGQHQNDIQIHRNSSCLTCMQTEFISENTLNGNNATRHHRT